MKVWSNMFKFIKCLFKLHMNKSVFSYTCADGGSGWSECQGCTFHLHQRTNTDLNTQTSFDHSWVWAQLGALVVLVWESKDPDLCHRSTVCAASVQQHHTEEWTVGRSGDEEAAASEQLRDIINHQKSMSASMTLDKLETGVQQLFVS